MATYETAIQHRDTGDSEVMIDEPYHKKRLPKSKSCCKRMDSRGRGGGVSTYVGVAKAPLFSLEIWNLLACSKLVIFSFSQILWHFCFRFWPIFEIFLLFDPEKPNFFHESISENFMFFSRFEAYKLQLFRFCLVICNFTLTRNFEIFWILKNQTFSRINFWKFYVFFTFRSI